MGETLIRWPALAAALAVALGAPACGRSAPPEAPPAPLVARQEAAPPLAGGPARTARDPALAEAALVAEPVRYSYAYSYSRSYGDDYDHRAHARLTDRERRLQARRHWVRHWYYRDHHLVFEHPERGRPVHHYAAPRRHAAAPRHRLDAHAAAPPRLAGGPHTPAPPPAAKPAPHPAALVRPHRTPLRVRPASKAVLVKQPTLHPLDRTTLALPLVSTQTAPAATPAQAAAAPAVDLATQLGDLTVAAAQSMKGAKLDVPPALSTGAEGKVVLTLPPDLLAAMRARAGQVGLGPAAGKVFVTAKLAGQGYAVTPNVEQTARLEVGEPTVFGWDVKPSATPAGVLTADMTGSLQGEGDARTFALGAVTAQIPVAGQAASTPAPIQAPVSKPMQLKLPDLSHLNFGAIRPPDLSRWHLRDLSIPGHPTLAIPGLGTVASYKVVAVGIVALILILLISIMRSASARRERAERRRRFHSFEAAHFGDEHS